ncbi:MAG: transposase [Chloroflexi bacterium]|nr:transposase [Chloroflexota bacterium]
MSNDVEKARHSLIHLLRSSRTAEEAAAELGHCLSWAYKWQKRFNEARWDGLKSPSRAPRRQPKCTSEKTKRKILEIRAELEEEAKKPNALSYIGAGAIRGRMMKRCQKSIPSISTIEKVLREAGVTKPRQAHTEPALVYPHIRVERPHQLTQMDNLPHYLAGGTLVNCFNALDVVSRYPDGRQYERKSTDEVLDFCLKTFQSIGISEYTQMDNESSFNGGRTHPYVIGRVPRLMLLVGTELIYSPYYHPESNAFVERFHRDYSQNVWNKVQMQNLPHVQQTSARFFGRYRLSRHHSALDGQSPAALHFASPPRFLPTNFVLPKRLPITEGKIHFMRAVSKDQTIPVFNVNWSAGWARPNQGVWATLFITLRGARLCIYDRAPDETKRRCFANHPFPLSEPVLPLSRAFQKPATD